MSKIQWKNLPNSTSHSNLLANNIPNRQTPYLKTCSSAPASANIGRRKNKSHSLVRTMSDVGSERNSIKTIPRDCVVWQIISQQLTLQLEQRRRSELASQRRNRTLSLNEQQKHHTTVQINDIHDFQKPSTANVADPDVEFADNIIENGSLLKMDAHIIPMEKLVERFNSDLTNGLTDDIVAQHHAKFGDNKLTPSRPPSLLWMLIKQLLIGFNGILWIATLFAFLSYVS